MSGAKVSVGFCSSRPAPSRRDAVIVRADYYGALGVSKNATKKEIKSAYRQKARQFHPDVNKEAGAEEKFKEISEACVLLYSHTYLVCYNAHDATGCVKNLYANVSQPGLTAHVCIHTTSGMPWAGPTRVMSGRGCHIEELIYSICTMLC